MLVLRGYKHCQCCPNKSLILSKLGSLIPLYKRTKVGLNQPLFVQKKYFRGTQSGFLGNQELRASYGVPILGIIVGFGLLQLK